MNNNRNKASNADDDYEYIVPAVDRAARILKLLRDQARGMTIAEVTEATGWHKSSVHKLLVTLNHHGLLERNDTTKQYSLGIALIEYGQFVLSRLDIAERAKSFLKELAEYSGETANYSLVRGRKVVVVDSVASITPLHVAPFIGTMDPLTVKSAGKAVLAFMSESQTNRIIDAEGLPAATRNSIIDRQQYIKELAAIRKRGYSTDFEEFRDGISGISAPVFNSGVHVMGTLSVVAPSVRMTREVVPKWGKKCAELAAKLSAMLPHS